MTSPPTPEPPRTQPRAQGKSLWAFVPVGMIGLTLLGLGFMAHLATDDPSFAVERDYYKKAVAWDDTAAQARQNARLGWQVDFEVAPRGSELELRVLPKDARGARLRDASVAVEAFANARAANVVSTTLTPNGERGLSGKLPLVHAGIWEFRLVVEADGKRFTQVLRREISGDAS